MTDYTELVERLRTEQFTLEELSIILPKAADAIEALQAEVKRLQDKLCDWCAVCPKERRRPENCEMLSETPVMYGPSEVQE